MEIGVVVPGRRFPHPDSLFVPQPVATGAEGRQVFRLIAATLGARLDVVDFKETGSPTTGGLAAVFVPGQNFPAYSWGDC